jgi:hypothetical protein
MDIRFLIPVLNGLTKQEVTTAIPKLIKLSQVSSFDLIFKLSNGFLFRPFSL